MKSLYLNEIEILKERFIQLFVIIMCSFFMIYIILFQFFIYNPQVAIYLIAGLFSLSYSYILVKDKYGADKKIHAYMIVAPLYNFFILLFFWNNSISSVISLILLPILAYVFFTKKQIILYSLYMVANIAICFLAYGYFDFTFPIYSRDEVVSADVVLFSFNLALIILVLIYNNKINRFKILIEIEDKQIYKIDEIENEEIPISTPENTLENDQNYLKIFHQLEDMMKADQIFKKSGLNISTVSNSLNVSYNHLSKIIRCNGYLNFNSYLNIYRINHVKKLIDEENLQKVTFMYIYTEAGFSNQATFNRVFKQIEGITPSEYISKIKSESIDNSNKVW